MQMSRPVKDFVKRTIYFVDALDGEQRTQYIDDILDDYHFVRSQNYPKPTVKKFYELFTKLVKKFGH